MKELKMKIAMQIFGLLLLIPATWMTIVEYNWELIIIIFLYNWSNNIAQKGNK